MKHIHFDVESDGFYGAYWAGKDDNVAKVEKSVKRLGSLHAKKGIFFVSGNHDFFTGHNAVFIL